MEQYGGGKPPLRYLNLDQSTATRLGADGIDKSLGGIVQVNPL